LRAHRLACHKGKLDLVFPNSVGNIDTHFDIVSRGFKPAQIAAGVVTKTGEAKYPGLHVAIMAWRALAAGASRPRFAPSTA
jgi:integrase